MYINLNMGYTNLRFKKSNVGIRYAEQIKNGISETNFLEEED